MRQAKAALPRSSTSARSSRVERVAAETAMRAGVAGDAPLELSFMKTSRCGNRFWIFGEYPVPLQKRLDKRFCCATSAAVFHSPYQFGDTLGVPKVAVKLF